MNEAHPRNHAGTIRRWCMYDWANSVYSLLITSTLFPVYFNRIARNESGGPEVSFFGVELLNSALFSFSVSFSFLLAGLLSPLLSAYADLSGLRKRFLYFFCILGSLACALLWFFTGSSLELGMILFVIAALGFSSSIVFYNSFLPDIATPDRYERISAQGFAWGYGGSVLLLLLILSPLFLLPGAGEFMNLICRAGFVLTGLWWLGFGCYAIRGLPGFPQGSPTFLSAGMVKERLRSALKITWNTAGLPGFLAGFFFMNMGVQTIMYLAAIFGESELKLSSEKLIATILILQVLAIGGAWLFARVASGLKPLNTLFLACMLWSGICVAAYGIKTELQFYGVAAAVGLVMGGSQSLLRSTFTHFLPGNEHGKSVLYGWYDLLEKFSIVLGTLVFGLLNQWTGSMRISTLVLMLFFLTGSVFFRFRAGGSRI
jgi:UMF1 family MFS transporter